MADAGALVATVPTATGTSRDKVPTWGVAPYPKSRSEHPHAPPGRRRPIAPGNDHASSRPPRRKGFRGIKRAVPYLFHGPLRARPGRGPDMPTATNRRRRAEPPDSTADRSGRPAAGILDGSASRPDRDLPSASEQGRQGVAGQGKCLQSKTLTSVDIRSKCPIIVLSNGNNSPITV